MARYEVDLVIDVKAVVEGESQEQIALAIGRAITERLLAMGAGDTNATKGLLMRGTISKVGEELLGPN